MVDIATPVIEWLNANPELAGLATFFISAAESIAIIGTIIPGSVMMTAIGALVGAGIIPFWPTLIWAILGAIVGDSVSYWLGYYFKDRIYDVWPFKQYPKILQGGEIFFRKHGSMSVFIGRFVGPVRALVPVVAGMFGMRPIIFTVANVTSAIGWAPAYMLPGFLLGAASSELPSEVAGHLVLTFLLWLIFAFFCIWLFQASIKKINKKINQFLKWIWSLLEKSRYFNILLIPLKPHDQKKTYGQLKLAFYFILVVILFSYLALDILFQGSASITINKMIFYLFRSLRSSTEDNLFLYISFLGDKEVLLPVIFILFAWFAWIKHWRMAWHTFAFGSLLALSVSFFKHAIHSTRPWGFLTNTEGYSFPSGHSTLGIACYLGLSILLIHILKIRRYRIIVLLASILVIAIGVSRLYFGVHWFTDIIGGWLLGSAILMLTILSYNRKPNRNIQPKGVILTIILALFMTYSFKIYHSFDSTKHAYTKLEWPSYDISLDSWWTQRGEHLPFYRINRFGYKTKIFNLQWLGSLSKITQILLENGWQLPPQSDWVSVLYRLSSVKSTEHLPLVFPLYLDKPPVLVLTKLTNDKQLLILRFWASHINMKESPYPLWVGMVEVAPSTYSWLFNKKHFPEAGLTPQWIFVSPPKEYDIKTNKIKIKANNHRNYDISMILIKPRG